MRPGEDTALREELRALRFRVDEIEHQRRREVTESEFRRGIVGLWLVNLATIFFGVTLVYLASH